MEFIKSLKNLFNFFNQKSSFIIVGVGPGDPSLLTLASIKAIKNADIIFSPISGLQKKSYAAEIVKKYIKNKKIIFFDFPMLVKNANPDHLWREISFEICRFINKRKSVVLLCLGDPSIYSSSRYIVEKILEINPKLNIRILPGISSISAAAALSKFDLLKKDEILKVFECPDDEISFLRIIENCKKSQINVLAIMKIGKRWIWAKKILQNEGMLQDSFLAVNIGMEEQFFDNAVNINSSALSYFSVLLIRLK